MRTDEIRFVTEVCRTGSMSAAARKLNITPQGLGKAIQRLEKELGVKLFTRTFEGVVPTPACNQIYEKLSDIVNAENDIRQIIGQSVHCEDEEVFMVSVNTVGIFVEAAIQEYNKKYGGRIRILESTLCDEMHEQAFIENKYAYRYCCREEVQSKLLLKEDIVRMYYLPLVGSGNPLASKGTVTYQDLSRQTLLVEDLTYPHIRVLLSRFEEKGLHPPTVKVVSTNKEIVAMRLRSDPSAVYFARARDKELLPYFHVLNFQPPFYTTLCLETHKKTMNKELLRILREKLKNFNE